MYDEERHDYIVEDLDDDRHLVIKESQLENLKARLDTVSPCIDIILVMPSPYPIAAHFVSVLYHVYCILVRVRGPILPSCPRPRSCSFRSLLLGVMCKPLHPFAMSVIQHPTMCLDNKRRHVARR